jgi:hypothetical protein
VRIWLDLAGTIVGGRGARRCLQLASELARSVHLVDQVLSDFRGADLQTMDPAATLEDLDGAYWSDGTGSTAETLWPPGLNSQVREASEPAP